MPTLTIPNTFVDAATIEAAEHNANFTAVATLLNSTKLDGDNLQTGGVPTAALADLAVTTAKIADANVTAAKLAAAVAGDGLAGGAGTALSVNVDGSTIEISSDSLRVKDSGITTAKINDGAVTQAKRASLGQQNSPSSGSYTTTSTSFSDVTGLSITITTTGRPVWLGLRSASTSTQGKIGVSNNSVTLKLLRDLTDLSLYSVACGTSMSVPCSSLWHIEFPAAGTYTYKVQARSDTGGTVSVTEASLVAYEL